MDKGKKYIKMCQLATEIQGNNFNIKNSENNIPNKDMVYIKHIWLPRQDQLQEMMIGDSFKWIDSLIHKFSFSIDNWSMYYRQFTSMEQMWLAYVMMEKYNKKWIDGIWK